MRLESRPLFYHCEILLFTIRLLEKQCWPCGLSHNRKGYGQRNCRTVAELQNSYT